MPSPSRWIPSLRTERPMALRAEWDLVLLGPDGTVKGRRRFKNLIVNAGIGLLSFALCIPAFVVIALGVGTGTALGIGVTLVIGVLWLIAVACWSSAMSAVFQLALYRYATQAPLPAPFAEIELGQAFTTKGSRRGPFGA